MNLGTLGDDFWLTLVGWAFVVIGLVFVRVTINTVRADLASRRWPQAVATLQRAEAATSVQPSRSSSDAAPAVIHGCRLEYEYHVAGTAHAATQWLVAKDGADAARIAAAHGPGTTRTIIYDPQAPEAYLLEPASGYGGLVWLLPFLAFAGFGALVVYTALG